MMYVTKRYFFFQRTAVSVSFHLIEFRFELFSFRIISCEDSYATVPISYK